MQMEGEEDKIFRSGDRTRRNKDGRRKDERYIELADFERSQRCTEVFRIGELLSLVYKRFCSNSQTIALHSEEGSEVGLDREAEEGVQRVEEKVYKRTGVSSARLR